MENGHDRVVWCRLTNSIIGNRVDPAIRKKQRNVDVTVIVNDTKPSSNSSADPLCTTLFVIQLLEFKLYHSIDLAVLTAMHMWVTQVELSLRILSYASNHGVRWSCG